MPILAGKSLPDLEPTQDPSVCMSTVYLYIATVYCNALPNKEVYCYKSNVNVFVGVAIPCLNWSNCLNKRH